MLFIGDDFVKTLGLFDFREQNRGYIGLVFIVSLSIVLAHLFWQAGKSLSSFMKGILDARKAKKNLEEKKRQLHDLTPDEKAYLSPYILDDENTQYFAPQDGIACGLAAKGILYQASEIGNLLTGFAYNIQPWVRKYLKQNQYLLEGANPNPRRPRLV